MNKAALVGTSPRPTEPLEGSEQVTPDMEQVLLSRLTEVAQQQAVTAQQQAVSSERLVGLLERMDVAIERAEEERHQQHAETRSYVDGAVRSGVKEVTLDAAKRDEFWRKFAILVPLLQITSMVMNWFKK
jgi:hypothetical protein